MQAWALKFQSFAEKLSKCLQTTTNCASNLFPMTNFQIFSQRVRPAFFPSNRGLISTIISFLVRPRVLTIARISLMFVFRCPCIVPSWRDPSDFDVSVREYCVFWTVNASTLITEPNSNGTFGFLDLNWDFRNGVRFDQHRYLCAVYCVFHANLLSTFLNAHNFIDVVALFYDRDLRCARVFGSFELCYEWRVNLFWWSN